MNLQLADKALRFQMTAGDIETRNLLARMYPQPPTPYFYGMGGLGDCTPDNCSGPYDNSTYNYDYWVQQGSQRGMVDTSQAGEITQPIDTAPIQAAIDQQSSGYYATYDQLRAAFGVELCNQGDPFSQFACAQRNQPKMNALSALQVRFNGAVPVSALPTNYTADPGYTPPPATPPTSTPPPANTSTYRPRVTFTTSRGGTTVYPGDTWTISISGAQPGSSVVVQGGKNGAQDRTPEGTADASGNWQLSGTFTPDMIGPWQETWSAGGVQAGSFSFNVQPAPTGSGSGSGTGTGSGGGTGTPPPGGGSGTPPPTGGGITIGGMTLDTSTLLIAGAALAGLFFLGGRK